VEVALGGSVVGAPLVGPVPDAEPEPDVEPSGAPDPVLDAAGSALVEVTPKPPVSS